MIVVSGGGGDCSNSGGSCGCGDSLVAAHTATFNGTTEN